MDKIVKYNFKYETHCHTSEASACGKSSASEMVKSYYKSGYRGLVITDHFFNGNCAVPDNMKWDMRVNKFCLGYENAKIAALDIDFEVFFGWEYGYHGTEFITLGLNKDFLLENSDILEWPLEDYFDMVHKFNGYIIHAHPFRKREYIKEIRLYTDYIDAVEVHNSGNDSDDFNIEAKNYALKNRLTETVGSDSHDATKLSGSGLCFSKPLKSIEDFIKELKTSNYSLSVPY